MALSKLLQIMGLLYRMETSDVVQLEAQILEREKVAWRLVLSEQAAKYRCTRLPTDPRKSDLTELKRMAHQDAVSIAQTWNNDVERQLQRLYDMNHRGNRSYYISNMEAWARARAVWKDAQIALQTEHATRYYTRLRFFQMNTIRPHFKLVGPPPVCSLCIEQFAAGIVDYQHVVKFATPLHINCPHEWAEAVVDIIPCDELWLGE